jgi:hypothetical protein
MFRRLFALIAVVLLSTVPVQVQQPSKATLSIAVSSEGVYSARLDVALPAAGSTSASLYTALLPMSLAVSSPTSSSDVHVGILAVGPGHTLLVIAPPSQRASVSVDLPGPFGLQKTPDGKGKLEWEFSDRFLSDVEKRLVSGATFVPIDVIEVTLPERYDPADISTYPSTAQRIGDRTFRLPVQGQANAFIAFPNPAQKTSQQAKTLISLFVGILAIPFQILPLRRRRALVFALILIVSAGVLVTAAYFGPRLPVGSEFLAFAAAAVPSALWSFVASAYLIVARRCQATIIGRVTINNVPATYVTVRLFDLARGQESKAKSERQFLDDDGRYQFFVWVFRGARRLRVTATYLEKTEQRAGIAVSLQQKTSEVPAINFVVDERPPNIGLEPTARK